MDLLLNDEDDLDITNGELSLVTGIVAVKQDVMMGLATWLGETPYDTTAGLPYLQVIFQTDDVNAVNAIIERFIISRPGVDTVKLNQSVLDLTTRRLEVSGTIRAFNEEIDFSQILGGQEDGV